MKRPIRVVLLGFGAINTRVAELLRAPTSSDVEIVGVIVRRSDARIVEGAKRITRPDELAAVAPDLILEAAGRDAVREWGEPALRAAKRLVVSSTSAFADEALLNTLKSVAREHNSQLVVSPGAIAGVDALAAAACAGLREVVHRIVKHPDRWGDTGAAPGVLFRGSAREAAKRYPQNANVTIVTALSGIGLDRTVVELVADPAATQNRHEIHAVGNFGSLNVTIENRPLASNPKSSEQAALALVRQAQMASADLVV